MLEPRKGLRAPSERTKMLVNKTEWPALVVGRRSYGKCQLQLQFTEVLKT